MELQEYVELNKRQGKQLLRLQEETDEYENRGQQYEEQIEELNRKMDTVLDDQGLGLLERLAQGLGLALEEGDVDYAQLVEAIIQDHQTPQDNRNKCVQSDLFNYSESHKEGKTVDVQDIAILKKENEALRVRMRGMEEEGHL